MRKRPPAIFVGDALGLDFLNSVATPVDAPVDWIEDGEGLLDWLEQAQLLSADMRRNIEAHALPGELDDVAAEARHLREWFRGFVRQHKGRPLKPKDLGELAPLNRLLQRDESFTQIALHKGAESPFELQSDRRWCSPETLLQPIGETLARFVCTEDFAHVKACEGPSCTLLFADHTKGHARRWCSMAICGNRAKQAAHRQRLRAAKSDARR